MFALSPLFLGGLSFALFMLLLEHHMSLLFPWGLSKRKRRPWLIRSTAKSRSSQQPFMAGTPLGFSGPRKFLYPCGPQEKGSRLPLVAANFCLHVSPHGPVMVHLLSPAGLDSPLGNLTAGSSGPTWGGTDGSSSMEFRPGVARSSHFLEEARNLELNVKSPIFKYWPVIQMFFKT